VSLILDALRKADSERERGSVPGLHTHPVETLAADVPARPGAPSWQWAVVAVFAVLAIAVVWYVIGRDAPPRLNEAAPVAPAPTASAAPSVAATAAPSTATSDSAKRDASPTQGTLAEHAAAPTEPLPVAEPAPWPQPARRKAPEAPASAAPPPAKTAATTNQHPQATQATPTTQAPMAAPAEPPIYAREQLPQNIQAELPAMTIGGSIYSPNAPDRSLIINGRLFRENQQLTAGLLLEQIRQRSAVLSYKGYRFEIRF
jgi:general secretion pathway protein B